MMDGQNSEWSLVQKWSIWNSHLEALSPSGYSSFLCTHIILQHRHTIPFGEPLCRPTSLTWISTRESILHHIKAATLHFGWYHSSKEENNLLELIYIKCLASSTLMVLKLYEFFRSVKRWSKEFQAMGIIRYFRGLEAFLMLWKLSAKLSVHKASLGRRHSLYRQQHSLHTYMLHFCCKFHGKW